MTATSDADIDIEIRQDGEDPVVCNGCADEGDIDIVIGTSSLTAWHYGCLLDAYWYLPAQFTGTWDELAGIVDRLEEDRAFDEIVGRRRRLRDRVADALVDIANLVTGGAR